MKLALLVLVVGCHPSGDDFPVAVGGGGFGGGVGGVVDSNTGSGDGGPMLLGRVCLMTDPRDQTSCAASGVAGLTVTLGTSTAITLDDGTFSIRQPASSTLVWAITGSTVVESISPFAAQAVIPAMPQVVYAQLQGDNGVIAQAGQGAAMVRVVHGGVARTGAAVTIAPAGVYGTFYDGVTASAWTMNATGAFGAAWIPGVTTGTGTITVTPQGQAAVTLSNVPIVDGALTLLTQEVP
jgi:hypothetical protein